jgi:hypothetical protein
MLTVLLAIRIARPFGQSVAVGLRLRILRLSSPSCHTLVPQDLFIYPPVFCLPPLFPWRLSSQSSAARILSSTLRFLSLAGSGYALRLPLLAWHNAGPRNLRCRSSLTGCRSPPPRDGGSTFSLLPQQPCRPLCLAALSVSTVSPARHRSRFFRQPHAVADTGQMPLPGLAISFRCHTPPAGRLRYVRPLHLTMKAFP